MNEMMQIRLRRARLIERSEAQRRDLSAQLELWQAPLALADRSIAAGRYLRRHPSIVAAAVALLVLLKPGRAFAWARRGFVLWRTWRWVSGILRQRVLIS